MDTQFSKFGFPYFLFGKIRAVLTKHCKILFLIKYKRIDKSNTIPFNLPKKTFLLKPLIKEISFLFALLYIINFLVGGLCNGVWKLVGEI